MAAIFESPADDISAETAEMSRCPMAFSAWPAPPRYTLHDVAAYRAEAERLRQEAIRAALLSALRQVRRMLTR